MKFAAIILFGLLIDRSLMRKYLLKSRDGKHLLVESARKPGLKGLVSCFGLECDCGQHRIKRDVLLQSCCSWERKGESQREGEAYKEEDEDDSDFAEVDDEEYENSEEEEEKPEESKANPFRSGTGSLKKKYERIFGKSNFKKQDWNLNNPNIHELLKLLAEKKKKKGK